MLKYFFKFYTIQFYRTCNLLFYTSLESPTSLRFSPHSTCKWHVTTTLMGSAVTQITFPYILTVKER